MTDEQHDYGLAPGERYEPDEAEEPPFDLGRPHVMTALGPILPDALGLCLPWEHLLRRPAFLGGASDRVLDNPQATLAELEDFYAAGGRGIVDATAPDDGRDHAGVAWVAARAPVHVVLVTGRRSPAEGETVEGLAGEFVRELTEGIGGGGARAGAILAGVGPRRESPDGSPVLRAAARAHRAAGAPILVRAGEDAAARAVAVLREEGVDPARVVVGNVDPARGEATRAVVGTGAWVACAEIVGGDGEQAAAVANLVAGGHTDRLLLSPGLGRRSGLRAYGGGPGWVDLPERFTLALMDAGLEASTVRQLLVENPARALAVRR